MPEFFFRPFYDSLNRAYEWNRTTDRWRYLQQGPTERLLCESCEQRLNQYEFYVATLWYEQEVLPTHLFTDTLVISEVDYEQFKLFHLSVLWRSSVATLPMYSHVRIGAHEETIRQMLLAQDPGTPRQYGVSVRVLVADDHHVVDELVVQPRMSREPGRQTCEFVFGGCAWTYFIEGTPTKDQSGFLAPNADLTIPACRFDDFLKQTLF